MGSKRLVLVLASSPEEVQKLGWVDGSSGGF